MKSESTPFFEIYLIFGEVSRKVSRKEMARKDAKMQRVCFGDFISQKKRQQLISCYRFFYKIKILFRLSQKCLRHCRCIDSPVVIVDYIGIKGFY